MVSKSIFASVTFWGAVVGLVDMIVPKAFPTLGVNPGSAAQFVVGGIAFITTVYGRIRAKQAVTVTGGQPAAPPTVAK